MAALIAAPGKPCVLLLLPLLLANCLVCTTIANLHRPIFSKTAGTYSLQSIERTVLHTIAHSADKHDATVKSLQSSNGSVLDTNPGNPQNRGHPHSVLAPQNRTRRRGTFYTLTSQKGTRNPINDVTRRGYGLFSSEQPCQNDSRTRLPAYNTSLLRHSSLCTLYYDTGQFTLSGFTDTSMDTVEAMLPQGNILPDISEWDAAAAEKKYVEISRAIAAAGKGRLVVGAGGYPVNSNRVVKQEVESGRDSMYNGALHGIPYGTTSEAVAAFGERRITATGLAATSGKNQAGVVKGFLSKTTAARATSQLVQNVQPDAVSVVSDNMAYFRAPTKEVPGYYEVHLHPGPGKKLSLAAALQTGGEGKVLPVLDPVSKTPALGVPGLRFPQFMQSVPGSQMVKVSFECRPLHSKGWNGGFQLMNTYTLPEIQHIADLAGWALHDLAVLVMQHLSGPMQHIYLDRVAEMAATPYRRERCIRALVLQSPVMRLLDIVQIAPVQGGPGALMLSFGNQASAEAFKAIGGIKAMVPGRYEMSLAYQLPLTRPADMSTGVDLVGIRQYPDQAGLREMAAGLVSIFREGEQNMKIVAGPAVQKVNTNLVLLTVDGGSYEVPDQAEGLTHSLWLTACENALLLASYYVIFTCVITIREFKQGRMHGPCQPMGTVIVLVLLTLPTGSLSILPGLTQCEWAVKIYSPDGINIQPYAAVARGKVTGLLIKGQARLYEQPNTGGCGNNAILHVDITAGMDAANAMQPAQAMHSVANAYWRQQWGAATNSGLYICTSTQFILALIAEGYDEHFSLGDTEVDMSLVLKGKLFHVNPGNMAYNVALAATGKKPKTKADGDTIYETIRCHALHNPVYNPMYSSNDMLNNTKLTQQRDAGSNGTMSFSPYLALVVQYITSPLAVSCRPTGLIAAWDLFLSIKGLWGLNMAPIYHNTLVHIDTQLMTTTAMLNYIMITMLVHPALPSIAVCWCTWRWTLAAVRKLSKDNLERMFADIHDTWGPPYTVSFALVATLGQLILNGLAELSPPWWSKLVAAALARWWVNRLTKDGKREAVTALIWFTSLAGTTTVWPTAVVGSYAMWAAGRQAWLERKINRGRRTVDDCGGTPETNICIYRCWDADGTRFTAVDQGNGTGTYFPGDPYQYAIPEGIIICRGWKMPPEHLRQGWVTRDHLGRVVPLKAKYCAEPP